MQYFCSEYKTDNLLTMGIESLAEIQEKWVPNLYASDPHKLMCCLESRSALECAQMVLQASLARKASCKQLDFRRIDYPQMDPPESKEQQQQPCFFFGGAEPASRTE